MTEGSRSQTTCCDSDSCLSNSKCYCQQGGQGAHSHHTSHSDNNNNNYANSEHESHHNKATQQQHHKKKKSCKKDKERKSSKEGSKSKRDNLGLDYELFTVSGTKTTKSTGNTTTTTSKSVKAHEALSVKKSVEAAAIFADVKLSQTTDITTLVSSGSDSTQKRTPNSGDKMNNLNEGGQRGHGGSDRDTSTTYGITKSDMGGVVMREKSLMKIRVGGGGGKAESIYGSTNGRPVSASGLEDSLGYLP